jgi:predicted phosphodiesterase
LRYLILSDIHANVPALDAVVAHAAGRFDTVVNCGDIVGYGPDPNEAIEFCRERCTAVVRGNHDKAVVGLGDLEWFSDLARTSAEWTSGQLTAENAAWLAALPQGPLECDGFTLVHGAPHDEDEYVVNALEVREIAAAYTSGLTFFGHTHLQSAFELHRNGVRLLNVHDFVASDTSAFVVNPGSVGQPRDRDPRAAYALYDTETRVVELRRADYDLDLVYQRVLRAGLPEVLALRLYRGM